MSGRANRVDRVGSRIVERLMRGIPPLAEAIRGGEHPPGYRDVSHELPLLIERAVRELGSSGPAQKQLDRVIELGFEQAAYERAAKIWPKRDEPVPGLFEDGVLRG